MVYVGAQPKKKYVRDFSETIYDLVHSPAAKEYWKQKDKLTTVIIEEVNWDAVKVAMAETKRSRRVFISKYTSIMCGVGKFMQRWKLRTDSACPRYV
jgi:hypothetical protein